MNNLKQITDKNLIVFLVACGLEIKQIIKDKRFNRSIVCFENDSKLDEYILKYTNKSVNINICEYISAERRVKTLLCMQKNN
ncbi:DUF5659 domain-containing protein [Clostridium magnum]|uniref:DUF5659 domain-containing protein n=1 Tax=Clostridium magnum DSM 2767 TaxID=1121326 RepID=A0A162UEI1_9CLOT|nr:DUF5659 domain-containing protein [Clostridium magnum]KZL93814.1 hypothetical protein CLMAG_08650 [Clostridium magnum DSM 2767]SHI08428.1 hypothetical protein SAMN02745944_02383 [Clostridium magnum DSM 2767]